MLSQELVVNNQISCKNERHNVIMLPYFLFSLHAIQLYYDRPFTVGEWFLLDKVRVADLVGTRIPPPASDGSSLTVNQTDLDRVSRFQDKVDQSLKNGELDQSWGFYMEKGFYTVTWRDRTVLQSAVAMQNWRHQNGSQTCSEDATEGKIGLDPSMPFVINNNDRPWSLLVLFPYTFFPPRKSLGDRIALAFGGFDSRLSAWRLHHSSSM